MNVKSLARSLKSRAEYLKSRVNIRRAEEVLMLTAEPVTSNAESCFERLQARYQPRPEYGYDPISIFRRASERALEVINLPGVGRQGLHGLDLGSGDGMLSTLLQTFGHRMTLTDLEDWRVEAAKSLSFVKADCCVHLPLDDKSFDFVISYNAFEHFPDPVQAFSEVLRVLRPQGLMHFRFNPLYCSPWGLHAYRTLRMPYPQFLFSEEFIQQKLDEEGIWDLGKKRNQLQALNCWKPSQFEALWTRGEVEVLECNWQKDEEHLDIINQYPESFQGRGLSLLDMVTAGVTVTLRKR